MRRETCENVLFWWEYKGHLVGGRTTKLVYVEVRVTKLKTSKEVGKAEDTGEMIKSWRELFIDWICKLCNIAFESGLVTQDYFPKCSFKKSMRNVIIDRTHERSEELIDDE